MLDIFGPGFYQKAVCLNTIGNAIRVCLRRSTVRCEAKVLEGPMTVRTHVYYLGVPFQSPRQGKATSFVEHPLSTKNAQWDPCCSIHRYRILNKSLCSAQNREPMIRQNPEILWLMLNPLTSNSSFTITNYYLSYKIWSPSLTLIFYRSIPSNDLHHCFLPLFMLILVAISCWEAALCLIFRIK